MIDNGSNKGVRWINIDDILFENDGHRQYTDVLFFPNRVGMTPDEKSEHPTQKPVGAIEVLIQWTTNEGMNVFDPFLGSGTTLVACEQQKRIGHGMEIDPGYVAICLERMQSIGLEPRLG